MAKILRDADLKGGTHLLLEYKLPSTKKWIDFLITGEDSEGKQNAVIVKLKQWDKAQIAEGDDIVSTYLGAGNGKRFIHPNSRCFTSVT